MRGKCEVGAREREVELASGGDVAALNSGREIVEFGRRR